MCMKEKNKKKMGGGGGGGEIKIKIKRKKERKKERKKVLSVSIYKKISFWKNGIAFEKHVWLAHLHDLSKTNHYQ